MACSSFLLDPARRHMEDRYTMLLGVNKDTLFFQLITFRLLEISALFVVLRREDFGGWWFSIERKVSEKLSSIVVVTFSQVVVENFVEI